MGVAGGVMLFLNESEVEYRDMWFIVMLCLWGFCLLMNGNFF